LVLLVLASLVTLVIVVYTARELLHVGAVGAGLADARAAVDTAIRAPRPPPAEVGTEAAEAAEVDEAARRPFAIRNSLIGAPQPPRPQAEAQPEPPPAEAEALSAFKASGGAVNAHARPRVLEERDGPVRTVSLAGPCGPCGDTRSPVGRRDLLGRHDARRDAAGASHGRR
jgi:hypothetical protein